MLQQRNRPLLGAAAWILAALALLAAPAEVTAFERIDGIVLDSGENGLQSAVIDPTGEFAYFGTNTSPGQVVKINLETFERVGAIPLDSGEDILFSAVIDPAGEFAYFGTFTIPGRVVKIDLETFERVGAIELASGENELVSAVIDPAGEFAYFSTWTKPGRVVKIDLATFQRVEAIALEDLESRLVSAVIDPAGNFAYFGTSAFAGPDRVVKVDLETFERVGAITLESGEFDLFSAVIDPAGEFAYFGTLYILGRVVKIDLETFERVGAITLDSGENYLGAAVIDPTGEFAYFGTDTFPSRVVKIDLETFERVDAITLDSGENNLFSAVIDPAGQFAYFGTRITSPGRVVKIGLTAPAPELSFDPASLDFGDVEVGTPSALQTATLENTGDANATELAFSISDPSNGFEIADNACGDTLPPEASCDVSVTFTPTAIGEASATLEVASAEDATAGVDLSGNGVSETQVFSPVALAVDSEPIMDLSDGNAVFEPGEQVEVAPAWRNDGSFPQFLDGTASAFIGPAGPTYTLVMAEAAYGAVEPGEVAGCLGSEMCYRMDIGPEGVERPVLHWDAIFDETLSDETTTTWALHVGDSFADVPRSHPFYRFVETALHHGLAVDCGDGELCPSLSESRATLAMTVLRAREGSDFVPEPCTDGEEVFADVPSDDPFCPWIEELANRGVVAGCGGGNYCPEAQVTRAQMSVFLLKTLEGNDYTPPACGGIFADVPCSSVFADWIEELFNREITGGCATEPLEYCPASPINRGQCAVFQVKTFELGLYGP